jgi:hypothetical protein
MADDGAPDVDEKVASSGFGSALLDRAKKATGQAQSSVSDLASKVASSKVGELKDAGLRKVVEMLDDFNAALPIVREAGYTLSSVDVGIGLPPKVSASFVASAEVSPENVERVLAEHADKKFTMLLVRALYQAWLVQRKIAVAGLKPKGLSVEIGLIPVVTVKFG